MRSASPKLAVLALLCSGCEGTPPEPAPHAPLSVEAPRPEAAGTLLVSLVLTPDGAAAVDMLAPRSFAYVGPLADFRPARAAAIPEDAPPPSTPPSPGVRPARETLVPQQPLGVPRAAPVMPPLTRYALVVSHAALRVPVEVPLGLASPRGARGDVADPWEHGGLILRAPHYGLGTLVELVAIDERGATSLASARWDETP